MHDALVQLEAVEKSYRLGRVLVRAVDGVTLGIARGDFMALAGPPAAGRPCSST